MSDDTTTPVLKKTLNRSQKFAAARLSMRQGLWPDVSAEQLWNRRTSTGFATIPRPLPVIMVIMDSLSVGKPVSTTYLDLWCRAFDESFVRLDKPQEMAFAAGFVTARGVHVWSERLDILKRLGFIALATGPQGPRSFALIFNPYQIIKRLHKAKQVSAQFYNALLSAATGVGAMDLDSPDTIDVPMANNRRKGKRLTAVA